MKNNTKKRAVLVTTEYKGVFFGYLVGKGSKESLVLTNARNCIYWSANLQGFLGLSVFGPDDNCKIGPAALRLELFGITSIADVTAEAEKKWGEVKWQS